MQDRPSHPTRLRRPTPTKIVERIIALRHLRWAGKHINREVGVSQATVRHVLRRAGISRLEDLEPEETPRRYERATPAELIHLDIKKLCRIERPGRRVTGGRKRQSNTRSGKQPGNGWEFVHAARDDHSRVTFTQIHRDEMAKGAIRHLKAAVAWCPKLGVKVSGVQTDNGSCYVSPDFAKA